MSKKLAAKAGLIPGLPTTPASEPTVHESGAEAVAETSRPKTAPGSMLHFMSNQSAAIKEAEALREQLRDFDGALPVRQIDASTVRPSKWANRHADNFVGGEFDALKHEIETSGGNVQPIRVRPLVPPVDGARYEVVYGHRRHRACLELGLPVRAMVEDASDRELFEAMERENRGRKNLSAWEQGCMYRQALDEGLYASLRKLAEAIGVDVSLVSKSVALARLPAAIVAAFPSPLDIQFRWAQPLSEAIQKNPDGVVDRARQLEKAKGTLTALQVFDALRREDGEVLNGSTPDLRLLKTPGKGKSMMSTDARGAVTIRLAMGAVPAERREALAQLIEQFVARA